MILLFVSLLAGVLSVLAPCILTSLPILLARSADGSQNRSPFFVIGGLLGSTFIFSILLKYSTLLIAISPHVWQVISGGIIIIFGMISLFPELWEQVSGRLRLQIRAQKQSGKALQTSGKYGDLLLGASLGPVFSACSPTYALIIASILPVSPAKGVVYLAVFLSGLGAALALISLTGTKVIHKLGWSLNPRGWFKRTLGVIFITLGVLLATGADKVLLSTAVKNGWFDWQVNLESHLQQE